MSKNVPKKPTKVASSRTGKKADKKASGSVKSARTTKFSVEIPPDKPKKGKKQ